MNWLDRARREIGGNCDGPTAITANGNPMAVLAVLPSGCSDEAAGSIGGNGSARPSEILESEMPSEAFEERAAIMEYDGGMSREDAERAAWKSVARRHRLH